MDLLARIDAWGRSTPDREVFRSSGSSMTWGELVNRSDALAGALVREFPSREAPVVLLGHKQPEMVVGFLGCAKAGIAYVPVDRGTPDSRVERIVAAAGAGLVLGPEGILDLAARGEPAPAPWGDASTPHYVMFTSGSTGEPKGVVITRGCLDAFLGWMLAEHRFRTGEEVFLNQVIYSFDVSIMDTWCGLVTGGSVVSITAQEVADFRRLFATLANSGVTTWVSTPPFAQLCLGNKDFAAAMLPRLTRFLFCGDVLTPEVARQLIDRFPGAEVWNTYGPTETTVATTSVRIDRAMLEKYPQLPIGYPMPGSRIVLRDDDGEPAAAGNYGEIVIEGPNVSPGYLGRPDLTARVFSERDGVRVYRTGDRGVMRDGLLFFGGRQDGQVKIAGHRIEMGDVEIHLASLPMVRAAVVLPQLKDGRAESLHAFVILASRPPGSDLEVGAAIRSQLATLVPGYMLPRKFHFLERFPLTPNGKSDRRALSGLMGP